MIPSPAFLPFLSDGWIIETAECFSEIILSPAYPSKTDWPLDQMQATGLKQVMG